MIISSHCTFVFNIIKYFKTLVPVINLSELSSTSAKLGNCFGLDLIVFVVPGVYLLYSSIAFFNLLPKSLSSGANVTENQKFRFFPDTP